MKTAAVAPHIFFADLAASPVHKNLSQLWQESTGFSHCKPMFACNHDCERRCLSVSLHSSIVDTFSVCEPFIWEIVSIRWYTIADFEFCDRLLRWSLLENFALISSGNQKDASAGSHCHIYRRSCC